MKNNIGQRIQMMRIANGKTLPQLAKESGVSKGLLSKLENSERANPTVHTIYKISHAFGLPFNCFMAQVRIET
jgi:transcriptional regulator with XRE-family HTH domain